jgi:uncharacterized protein (TIGR03083 family)
MGFSEDLAPVLVADRFSEVRARLLELLRGLSEHEWELPTAAPLWSVKDVALHLLGGDLGNLSRRRDAFTGSGKGFANYGELVEFINGLNKSWVETARRLSPRVLFEMLAWTGPQMAEYWQSLDPHALGGPVDWAGDGPAPVWMDVAREYTEQWHHQQQIRDAAGRPGLYEPRLFGPALETFMLALPRVYEQVKAEAGAAVRIVIVGQAGGEWVLVRGAADWVLGRISPGVNRSSVSISEDVAWRLFTKGMTAEVARRVSKVEGEEQLAAPFFGTVAVIG